MKKSATNTFALAASLLIAGAAHAAEDEEHQFGVKKEKCYCVVKAGHNDCANSTGSHQCATYATEDQSCAEWVLLPEGTCERILDGSLEPKR